MSKIVNVPRRNNFLLRAIRGTLEHRATWLYLLLKAAEEKGVPWEDIGLQPLGGLIYGLHELFYSGIENPKATFSRAGCFDVGVRCGGWGHIVMEIRMEDRKNT